MAKKNEDVSEKQIKDSEKITKVILKSLMDCEYFAQEDIGIIRDCLRERFPDGKNNSKESNFNRIMTLLHLAKDINNEKAAELVERIIEKYPNSQPKLKDGVMNKILNEVRLIAEGKNNSVNNLVTLYKETAIDQVQPN